MSAQHAPLVPGGILALLDAVAPAVSLTTAVACVACTLLESGSSPLVLRVFAACEKVFPLCSTCVTFSLGFFLSTSYARWWKLRDLAGTVVGRTVDTMVMICTYLNGTTQKSCDGRRKLARYLLLAHAVSLQASHRSFRPDKLLELGLVDENNGELHALEQANTARYNITYQWFLSCFYSQLTVGVDIVARGNIMFLVQANVSHMRGGSADILMYLNERIPRPIVMIAQVITTLYCAVIAPIALASQMRWYAAPASAVLCAFFYGLMSAAAAMQDPFHGRLCAFDSVAFLKTTQTACDDLLAFRADLGFLSTEPQERWSDNAHWASMSFSPPATPRPDPSTPPSRAASAGRGFKAD
ncbi:Bestrophin, RFP-TM, chloride channel-domain-containing protein [Pavlovales sp. CCMP2436]|nr:Bestrophin, RFP-TM, chloride channel-domain-containing protein [Pavlovales sp. CCMP2436]|mmetsp:Transcript_19005/g.48418  ORF Transcript_19005/g.48418 Transcript_19005/m.48418 type:complete len:356 (+) Transcript_19005:67-1134(+)